MRMLGPCIDAQVGHQLTAQLVARKHALDGQGQNPLGIIALEDLLAVVDLIPPG